VDIKVSGVKILQVHAVNSARYSSMPAAYVTNYEIWTVDEPVIWLSGPRAKCDRCLRLSVSGYLCSAIAHLSQNRNEVEPLLFAVPAVKRNVGCTSRCFVNRCPT
jgi:hypothetical protein